MPPQPPASFVALRDVRVTYGPVVALAGLDLDVAVGERLALVGPSGSGKTTLLRICNAMLSPTEGDVQLFGTDLTPDLGESALRAIRTRIAYVPQELGLVPSFRVSQNIAAGRLGTRGLWGGARDILLPKRSDLDEIHATLDRVGIADKLYARTDQLSGGQQQRVAVARALYQGAEAVLADEPVSSVDPARARDTVSLLSDLCEEGGLSLIMSLHNLDLAREFFPRLVGLRAGRATFDRDADELGPEAFDALYDLSEEELLGG